MSAQIIQFPGNSAGKAQRPESGLQALIEIDQMQDYRMWSIETQRCFAEGLAELAFMVRSYAADSKPPQASELEALMWQFAGAMRRVDFADKFLVVHGHPFGEVERYEQLRRKFLPEISHRLCSVSDDI